MRRLGGGFGALRFPIPSQPHQVAYTVALIAPSNSSAAEFPNTTDIITLQAVVQNGSRREWTSLAEASI